jgi:hypothetical protein
MFPDIQQHLMNRPLGVGKAALLGGQPARPPVKIERLKAVKCDQTFDFAASKILIS